MRTDEDVGHGALTGLLLQVILNVFSVISLIDPINCSQQHQRVSGLDACKYNVLNDRRLNLLKLLCKKIFGPFAVRTKGLRKNGNFAVGDGGLATEHQ
jgi:hypothetical protein